MSKSTTFTITIRLVLLVILVVNVHSHIYNYCSYICDYNVDITKEVTNATIVCDYYIFGWKNQMKVHIFHPILNVYLDR